MKYLLPFLLLFSNLLLAQNKEADSLIYNYLKVKGEGIASNNQEYVTGIRYFQAAQEFRYDWRDKLQASYQEVIEAIEKDRDEAFRNARKADSASRINQQFQVASYFYQDSIAIAFQDFEFYFMNPQGEKYDILKQWDAAFMVELGVVFAKVRKKTQNTLQEFYLDVFGRIYPLAYRLNDLSDETLALDLQHDKLKKLPKELSKQTQLEILLLANNRFKKLPKDIHLFEQLQILDLSDNELKQVDLKEKNLWQLNYLNLSKNKLKEIPNAIEDLPKIQELRLAHNEINNLRGYLKSYKTLLLLDLSYNKLSNIQNPALPPYLQELSLEGNQMTLSPIFNEKHLNLRRLNLSNCQLTGIPLTIDNFENLHYLQLSNNQIQAVPQQVLELKDLRYLDLQHNRLKSLPDSIGKLEKLETLILSNNQLTYLPETIGDLDSLQSLDVSNNNLNELPEAISKLKLRYLNLRGNPNLKSIPKTLIEDYQQGLLMIEVDDEISNILLENTNSGRVISNNPPKKTKANVDYTKITVLNLRDKDKKVVPDSVFLMINLEKIYLSDNLLEEIPEYFGQFSKLKNLDLRSNPDFDLKSVCIAFQNYPKPIIMDSFGYDLDNKKNLDNVLIIQIPKQESFPSEIDNLQSLYRLELYGSQLSHFPESFGHLKNLERIYAPENQIDSLPDSFGELESLETLNLSGSQLSELPSSFVNLQKLRVLDLSNNQLKSLPNSFGNLQGLRTLSLTSNQLSSLPDSFGQLQKLQSLFLIGNPIPIEEQKRIKNMLPNCAIHF